MSLKCAYHPEIDASDKCEKCGKVICLECKMVYHETIHSGTGDSSYAYSKRYELCPPCFYDRKIKVHGYQNMIGGTIGIIIIISFIVFTQYLSIGTDFFSMLFMLIPILAIVCIIISVFIYGPIKLTKFKSKKEEFLNSIQPIASIQKEEAVTNICIECGNRIDPGASICSYCGASTKNRG